ncbi:MAG: AAA family ATPase [Candidatus Kerfeldbacteria bacterium]|nr:AAA family ATPase [Candidatus Kerfeldbacteria bacterium]
MADARPSSTFVICPTCGGTGLLTTDRGRSACTTCHNRSVILRSAGHWLTWGKPVTTLHLLEERAERLVHATIDGLLIAFGIVGAAYGVLESSSVLSTATLANGFYGVMDFFIEASEIRSGGMFVFWLSLLTDLYLYYRLEQTLHVAVPIAVANPLAPDPGQVEYSSIRTNEVIDVSRSYTRSGHIVVEKAFALAKRLRQASVEPIHLLAAVGGDNDVALALVRLGVRLEPLRDRIQHVVRRGLTGTGDPVLSPDSRRVLARAYERSQSEHLLQVTPPHILEAIAEETSDAQEVLLDLDADTNKVHNVVLWALMQRRLYHSWSRLRQRALNKPKSGMDRAMTAQATPMLEHFSVDLTRMARNGTLPLMLDRERETEDVYRIVESGRHNVILVGDKGVGTTSMLYALAERMAAEDVPAVLQDKRLVMLSVAKLVSGASKSGELEQRLEEIIIEIAKAGNVVLAIEDIHELVGVSSVSGDALDLAGILGKVLENRAFVAFATTTPQGYRQYIEPSALFTAFEKIDLQEVPPDVAIQILESKAAAVENRHRVFFSYAAIEKIVSLSVRYIHDRYLPEKALTLLEEVGAFTAAAKGAHSVVSAEDAAAVIGRRTNTNVAAVNEDEATKLMKLEERMHERMIGQDYAVQAVANALRRSRAELRDPKRPIGVFLFLGPTGVGKTELAKTVADVYFGAETSMTRLDMSEYQEPASIDRLIGRSGTKGFLTEAVRVNPFSLILLDELEKAHPDVLNVFLQVFDDGRLTDAQGRTIDFTNTIIIATSNAGTDLIQRRMKEGQEIGQIRVELVQTALGQYFRPEFINRFDDVIVFTPLTQSDIEKIAALLLDKIARQLDGRGIALRATPEAIRELAAAGYDPLYGARPLRRVLQERVDNALANYLLTGKLSRRDVAVLESGGIIRVEPKKEL